VRMAGRARARTLTWPMLAIVLASAVGTACSSASVESGDQATTSTTSRGETTTAPHPMSTITVRPKTCPDVSGFTIASDGVLSLGPFSSEALGPAPGAEERKLWLASQREGSDTAILLVTDPAGHTTRQARAPGKAFVDNAAQFYPGTIPVGRSGSYKLLLTIGQDTLCVTAGFQVAA
jgi:hypothetical protein